MSNQATHPTPTGEVIEKNADATTLTLESKFTFGKYKRTSKTVADVVLEDPEYLTWAAANVPFIIVPPEILALCYDAVQGVQQFDRTILSTSRRTLANAFDGHTMPLNVKYLLDFIDYALAQSQRGSKVTIDICE